MREKSIRETINEELERTFGVTRARAIRINKKMAKQRDQSLSITTERVSELRQKLRGNLLLRLSMLLTRRELPPHEEQAFIEDLKDDLEKLGILSREESEEFSADSLETLLDVAFSREGIDPREYQHFIPDTVENQGEITENDALTLYQRTRMTLDSLFPPEFFEGKIRDETLELLLDMGLSQFSQFDHVMYAWYPHVFYELDTKTYSVHVHRFTEVSQYLSLCLELPGAIVNRSQFHLLRRLHEQGYNLNEILLMSKAGSIIAERFPDIMSHHIARFLKRDSTSSPHVSEYRLNVGISTSEEVDSTRFQELVTNINSADFQKWLQNQGLFQSLERDPRSEVVAELDFIGQHGKETTDEHSMSSFFIELVTINRDDEDNGDVEIIGPPRLPPRALYHYQLRSELRAALELLRRRHPELMNERETTTDAEEHPDDATHSETVDQPSPRDQDQDNLQDDDPTRDSAPDETPQPLMPPPVPPPPPFSVSGRTINLQVEEDKVELDPPLEKIAKQECAFNTLVVMFLQEFLQKELERLDREAER